SARKNSPPGLHLRAPDAVRFRMARWWHPMGGVSLWVRKWGAMSLIRISARDEAQSVRDASPHLLIVSDSTGDTPLLRSRVVDVARDRGDTRNRLQPSRPDNTQLPVRPEEAAHQIARRFARARRRHRILR